MRTKLKIIRALAVAAFLSLTLPHHAAQPLFVLQPENVTAEVGTYATFSVVVSAGGGATYQWQFNGVNIPSANSNSFQLPSVTVDNVGRYTVYVSWGSTNATSSTAFLSVYELMKTNSTIGTLTTDASIFVPPPTGTFHCPYYYTTILFSNWYNPADSAGNPYYFYGPNVPSGAMTGPFANDGHSSYLHLTSGRNITNTTQLNAPIVTGLEFYESFYPPTSGYCGCEAGSGNVPQLDYYSFSLSTSQPLARYRLTIYDQGAAPPSGKVVFQWKYF